LGGSPSYVELLTCLQLAREMDLNAGPSATERLRGRQP
jgi:hypothetical protein